MSAKAVMNQMVPPCAEWWGETDDKATTPDETDAKKILTASSLGELETTRIPSYYTDEDYPAGPEIQ